MLAAPAVLAPLAELTGAIDRVADTRPLKSLAPELHGAALAVNLHGKGPQSTALLRATEPRRLIAFAEDEWDPAAHEVARWCGLLERHGIPADPDDLRIAAPPHELTGATLIHPGAASPARRWPAERFAAVAEAERAAGRDVIVSAGPGERALAEAVGGDVREPEDLLELAALVAGAARVVCGDTGVAHLATALGISSVVLFGPVPPAEWGPPPGDRHVALHAGGRGDPHGQAPDASLLRIGVADVLEHL